MNRSQQSARLFKLDILHRNSLDKLIERFGIKGLSEEDCRHINLGWHRLAVADSVPGLTRLKKGS